MKDEYSKNAVLFKALADANRLRIVDILSCGELCACKILEGLGITQPTLSHHMKILCECGFVSSRRDGKWAYYSLDTGALEHFKNFLSLVTSDKNDSECKEDGNEL